VSNVKAEHPCYITVSPPLQVAQSPVDYQTYAVYSCDAGYLLVGSYKRYCGYYGELDDVEPTCAIVSCPNLSATSPLSVSVSDLTYVSNGVATYLCAVGYYLSGSIKRLCQADGTWSGSAPTCSSITCPSLTPTSLLSVTVSDYDYIANGVATYSCEIGYFMSGSNQRTCQVDGTWSGSEPTCSLVMCPPLSAAIPLSVNAQILTYNSDATYSCEIGYSMSGSNTRTCQADGSWSGSEPACAIVTCPLLFATNPLSVSAPILTYDNNATYVCATGYSMSGSNLRTCQADGTWSGLVPTCSIVSCPSLTAASPLFVSAASINYASVATYSCLTGYSMSGTSTRSCEADGTWSGSAPTCAIITCPTLSPTSPLIVNAVAVNIGDVATYSCATGFEINGTNTRTCQNDGTWDDAEPTCTPITCPTMTAPINGQVNFPSGFGVGGEAVFGCNPGYILSDDRTATCTVAGTWDIVRPSCLYNGKKLRLYYHTLQNYSTKLLTPKLELYLFFTISINLN